MWMAVGMRRGLNRAFKHFFKSESLNKISQVLTWISKLYELEKNNLIFIFGIAFMTKPYYFDFYKYIFHNKL